MPEGTVICQVEEKRGDRGKLARASGMFFFKSSKEISYKCYDVLINLHVELI